MAVGSAHVVEAVNDSLSVWDRAGNMLGSVDLNAFFLVPAGYSFTDPRLVYDTLSSRWFLSGMAFDNASDSRTYLATSATADPTGSWYLTLIASSPGVVTDQPKVGVSTDKVVMSWNGFNNFGTYVGQQTVVLQKSDLLSHATVRSTAFAADLTRSSIVPAVTQSQTTTEFLAYNDSCSLASHTGAASCSSGTSSFGVVAITGTPANSDVVWSQANPTMAATFGPPPAAEPGGGTIETNDDRLLSVTWQNGTLWATGNTACIPNGDASVRSCLRLTELSTANATIVATGYIGLAGTGLYFPAVTTDATGNPYLISTVSSSSINPSLLAWGQASSSSGFVGAIVWSGAGSYSCSFCGGTNRWGDYSAAVSDPINPTHVWVAGEYATAAGGDNWGTAAGEVSFDVPATPPPSTTARPPTVAPIAQHGYWLVGGDGGIFTFGAARFFGSTGNLTLQRPVVGITPTATRDGYWLVASDGGIFAFGDSGFYGSLPGLGIGPAGAGSGRKLSAPIVGMVPSTDSHGYFMVGADGGVFAFGDAHFEGSCPGIGGCSGPAVAVMPDASGNGYWLVTATGNIYTFGDASYYGAPGPQSSPVTSAVRTADGNGYWILFANGNVATYGDAPFLGAIPGQTGGLNPATAIFATAGGGGYWITSALGAVYSFGDAPYQGGMSDKQLKAPVIAATGW
jgi:hypothetical protein